MADPILIPIRRGRLVFLAVAMVVLAFFSLGFSALAAFNLPAMAWMFLLSFLSGGVFAALTVFFGGMALRAPVALRMDEHGISGFYAEPTLWSEISDIDVVVTNVNVGRGRSKHRHLGFALHDPVAFRDRQSAFRRFTSWSNGRGTGYHIVVPELVLQGAMLDELAAQAKALKADAQS